MTFKIREVIITYVLIVIGFLLFSQPIYSIFGIPGIPVTHFLIIFLPVIIITGVFKKDYKQVFFLNKPDKLSYIFKGIALWFGALIISAIYAAFAIRFLPEEQELIKTFDYLFSNTFLWQQILLIGLMPAITEELLFRGFIFSSFLKHISPVKAIIISSAMFAAMHLSLLKFVPTFLLGVVFSYTVYKTKSIYSSMLLHFINNTFSVVVQSLVPTIDIPQALIFSGINLQLIILLAAAILLIKSKKINSIKYIKIEHKLKYNN